MNDFTKEELEKLRYAITNYDYCDDKLNDKIQSMIDNYCEHEFDMTDWVNDSSGCRWYECKKCEGRYR